MIPRRSAREHRPPERYHSETFDYVNVEEPEKYKDICKLPTSEQEKWNKALEKELNSLKEPKVYEEVLQPADAKVVGCRWVFKKKIDADGNLRYRARLVAKGYSQTSSDYDQVFAPALRPETLRFVLA